MASETQTANITGIQDPQRKLAALFGGVLVLLGVVGFSGVLATDGLLLGVFSIPLVVNVVHMLTGLLGLVLAAYPGAGTLFNKVGGVIYLVVFLVGALFVAAGYGGLNWATNGLHLLLAVVVGAVGFEGGKRRPK